MPEPITRERVFELVKKLSEIPAVSGREAPVRDTVIELVRDYADEVMVDALGNVIAVKRGGKGGARLMIAAHMDEIGLFVTHIESNGFLRVTPVGGVMERALVYQRVIVVTRNGRRIRGVIGMKPPHVAKPEELRQVPEIRELFVDIGASSREEAEKMGIRVGDYVVYDRDVAPLGEKRVTGKALDDRIGLAVMIAAFQALENNEVDVYAVATVQEEVGLKGARTSAFRIAPHAALAIDVTIANDFPGVAEHEQYTRLGKGPAIKIADGRNAVGLIAHPEIVDMLVKVAEEEKIPYQLEVIPGGTTDASIIALNREGVPAGVVSVPARYIHSPVEVVDLDDAVNAARLVKAFAEKVTGDWLQGLQGRKVKG